MGASSGIGKCVAERMIRRGWSVGLAARRKDILDEMATNFSKAEGQTIITAAIDVTDERAADKLLALIGDLGGVDLYFHASGIGKQNPELAPDIELNTVNTNGLGFTRMIGAAFRYMAAHGGGRIACISSIAGTKGLGPAPSYSATKAMQNTYIEALQQLANSRRLNIAFTDIRPGFVDTPLLSGTHKYPLMLNAEDVADEIMRAIDRKQAVRVIDWKWRIITRLWRLIPHTIWRKMKLSR